MSSSTVRTANFSERRTTAAKDPASLKSRVPSGHGPAREPRVPHSPQPSISSTSTVVPPASSRHVPTAAPMNGELTERRTERERITTRETVSISRRPSVKEPTATSSPSGRRDAERAKAGSRTGAARLAGLRKEKEVVPDPWKPQASLIDHTSAPLACRVSVPPLASTAPQSLQPPPFTQLSLEAQEAAILEDLLFVFMGYEGQYIRFLDSYSPAEERDRLTGPSFRILPGLDPSLRDLTMSMLKVATYYVAVEAFVEVQSRDEFGTVNHALCAAIRKLLKDYLVLIAQLEHQYLTNPTFTLHVFHLHTLPTGHMLFQVYSLAHEILKKNSLIEEDLDDEDEDDGLDDADKLIEAMRDGGDLAPGHIPGKKMCRGGSVLGLITRKLASMSGDPAARSLLTTLLREASRPYMSMLNEWIHHGSIRDPHQEFLIKEQKSIRKDILKGDYTDQYWEKRYTIRMDDLPPQLEGVKDKVLLAGKYLNVIRECGGVDVSKEVADVPKTFDDVRVLDNINAAYAHANSSLLDLLITTHELPARLRSFKHYFFLDRSDFFSYFLELGTAELKKPAKLVNVSKLQSVWDLVLRQPGSVAAEDPFKEDVKVQMNSLSLSKWLLHVVSVSGLDPEEVPGAGAINFHQTPMSSGASSIDDEKEIVGFNALELDYSVPFPLSLVIGRKTVLRYQLLFRYLLSLRHLESLLVDCWSEHTKVRSWRHKSSNPELEKWKRRAWTLRARMLVFVQQLIYYCTSEVIEPNWVTLMGKLHGDDEEEKEDGTEKVSRTVDGVMQDHVDFLDTCLKECMLTNSKLLRIHAKIMTTCTMFTSYTSHLSKTVMAADFDASSKANPGSSTQSRSHSVDIEKLSDNLSKYEINFSRHLKILLDAINFYAATETVVLLGLCARLATASEGTGDDNLGSFRD